MFSINQNDGIISTRTILERSRRQNYTIDVVVSDKGSPPQEAVFSYTVMVLGEHDSSLPFSKTNLVFSVPENSRIGRVVGSVRPGEPNYDLSTVWYSILARNDDNIFDIENHSGNLLVVRNLDADTNQEYNLKISLNDNTFGMAREVIRVKIIITDVNDNPPAFRENPLQIAIAEDSPVGSPVYTISAQDIDNGSNGSIRYNLQEQFPANYFRMDSLSGELFLVKKLSYEASPKVFLTVRATDSPFHESGRRTSDVAVIVSVEDVNDHTPQFVSTNKKQIQRGIDVGVPFHRVLAVDADSDSAGEIQYRIGSGDSDGTFKLDASTGLLSVSKRPRKTSYRLDIKATDEGSPPRAASQLLQVTVGELLSGPPKFTNSVYRAEVAENSAPRSHLTTVRALKQGSSNNLFYSLDEQIARGLFGIDERSGEIRTVGNLDREERGSYIVTVYVHDSATPPSFDTATVLIKILDENDHAPTFQDSCYPLFVPENTDLSSIHQFIATDLDSGENGAVTYSLVGGDDQNKFSIDAHSGQLSASPLDHEEHAAYRLRIRAEDQGTPKKQTICEATVRVLDRNDNDPVFTEQTYQARLRENVPDGTPVKSVVATDADSGPNAKISYSIRNGTEWIFGIDRDSGLIFTTGQLDREHRAVYRLEVVAVDEGVEDSRMAQAVVQITIEDENDSQPEFDEYPFMAQILPQLPPGQPIVQISAKDQDEGPNSDLKYAFLNLEDKEKFAIDAGTGVITSRQSLLPDDGRMFHLEILVTDSGTPSLSSTGLVEIRIGQQPNVQLNFQQKIYSAEVEELSSSGVDILQVQAVRSDGRKQRVIYTFGRGNEDGTFEINSNNGLVRLQNPQFIDFEARRQFNLTIIGHAAGSENLYAYASCIISVKDKNDNKPRFTQAVYFARAWEGNNKGTYVSQVVAVDGDSIENEQLYYQIVDGNHDGAFAIDQQYSGIIKTNIVLDREIRDYYELTVTATDEGTPPLTGYTKVVITIIDVNDNQPQFPRSQPIVISEGEISDDQGL
jgi:protocadherin-16/23